MGFPIQHNFRFDKNNQNYVKALLRYNSLISIEAINGINLTEGFYSKYKIKDLPRILEEKKSQLGESPEITLTCKSWVCSSAYNTLPPLKFTLEKPVKMEDAKVNQQIATTISYLSCLMTPIDRPRSEVYYCPPNPKFSSEQEVHALLTALDDRYPNKINALHLPASQAFLIQQEDQSFILYYGYDEEGKTLGHVKLGFDVDDGFLDIMGSVPGSAISVLNEIFELWKKHDYQGDMFTKENSEFVLRKRSLMEKWLEHDFDEAHYPKDMVDADWLQKKIDQITKCQTQLQAQIDEIKETYSAESSKSEEALKLKLDADKDYQHALNNFKLAPVCISRLEKFRNDLQSQATEDEQVSLREANPAASSSAVVMPNSQANVVEITEELRSSVLSPSRLFSKGSAAINVSVADKEPAAQSTIRKA